MKDIKPGDFIEITKRLISDKVQPHIKLGLRCLVQDIDRLADGTKVLILSRKDHKKGVRCNAKRFCWRLLTEPEMNKDILSNVERNRFNTLNTQFGKKEVTDFVYRPLVIAEIAWMYALKAVQYGVDNRVKETLNMSRNIRYLYNKYTAWVFKNFDGLHLDNFRESVQSFIEKFSRDFTILYYTANNLILSQKERVDHKELRAYAFLSILFVKTLRKYEDKVEHKMALKIGETSFHLPILDDLRCCMSSYLDNQIIYEDGNIKTGIQIFKKNLTTVNFNLL